MAYSTKNSQVTSWQQLIIGIGDDAAAWSNDGSMQLATVDSFIQDVHFSLSVSPSKRVAKPDETVSYTVDVTGIGGFDQPVDLVVVGLPPDVGVAWSVNPVYPDGSSNLTLSVSGAPSFGYYQLYVVGTSGTEAVSRDAELTIDYPFKIYVPIILKSR